MAWVAAAISLAMTQAAWADSDVKVYKVPKAKAAAGQLPAGHPPATTEPGPVALKYKTPEGWTEVAPGQMRAASFNIKDKDGKMADVSVIPLPGRAGGDVSNVNRWRGQVALAPLTEEELKKTAEAVTVGEASALLYDLSGTNTSSGEPSRILAAILHRDETAWFFKVTGDDQLVAAQKPAFIAFVKSVQFVAASEGSGLPAAHPPIGGEKLPPSHPPIGGEGLPVGHPEIPRTTNAPVVAPPVSREGQPKWQVPGNWKEVSGGQFLVAKFLLTGESNTQAAVNVSKSAGDGGGLAGNVNRWRGQLSLGQLGADEITKSTKTSKVAGGEATFIEIVGTDGRTGQPAKIIGAMVPRAGESWFYKLMGDVKLVDAERGAFTKFVESVKY